METLDLRGLKLKRPRRHRLSSRLFREWCFIKVVLRHVRLRFAALLAVLLGGGLLFRALEPEKGHSLLKAIYFTFSLIFGEAPEEFPQSWPLQVFFFVVPLLGLLILLEGLVDFALILRDRRRNERSFSLAMAASISQHVVLVGVGRLGIRIYRLLKKLGEPVVVLEGDAQNPFLDEIRADGWPFLIGDARRDQLLVEANVAKAKALIAATNDDLVNLEVSLDAKRMNPNIQVILRMFDQNMADKVQEGFGIKTAMSQSAISAPVFVMAAVDPDTVATTVVGEELVVMRRWTVIAGDPLCGRTVAEVLSTYGAQIVKRRPNAQTPTLFPPPETLLNAGDGLIVQTTFDRLAVLLATRRR